MKSKTTILFIFLLLSFTSVINAQDTIPALPDEDTVTITESESDSLDLVFELPDTTEFDVSFDANADSMLQIYYVASSLKNDSANQKSEESYVIPTFPDSAYKQRLESLPMIVELSYNNVVRRYIDVYTVKKRRQVEVMLGLSEHYFPIFDDIFDYYGVPNEMKYMSIIESALNPKAYSRARAVGLWQFMYGTGRIYGLEINSLVDERMDPIKSTHAAVKFISDLHDMYGDWLLALAAYNCGPGNVNKAIRRSGGKKNFWEIYYYLPRETRGHVPAFIAAIYTMNFYAEHDLHPVEIEIPVTTDTIFVNHKLHLQQVSEVLGIPLKQIRDLNPQYRYDIVPGQTKPYALRLPVEQTLSFIDLADSIYAYKDSVFFNKNVVSTPIINSHEPSAPSADYIKLHYTVKSGDAVGLIADWYDVRSSDLTYWNNINRNIIRSGQKLVIYKHKNVASKYEDINSISYAEKQTRNGYTVKPTTQPAPVIEELKEGEYILYTVRSGDTLWEIAQKYPGVTDTDIMKWNGITNAGKIAPGQKLKIKSKS
ncbi:MAG: LysM peptidoglycan-binding domain-containing protein [Bacteroidales bacterium]|nr:LysM peptidoglycan-binding domain-containing protein [Bacteroidales bacterium]MBN2818407.1 LysM peptidoglycan-binding domain-containing protein [Bacteroidales bacterium]